MENFLTCSLLQWSSGVFPSRSVSVSPYQGRHHSWSAHVLFMRACVLQLSWTRGLWGHLVNSKGSVWVEPVTANSCQHRKCLPRGDIRWEVCESPWRGNSQDVKAVYHLLGRGILGGFFFLLVCFVFLVWKILQPSGAHMFPFLWLQVLNLQLENWEKLCGHHKYRKLRARNSLEYAEAPL